LACLAILPDSKLTSLPATSTLQYFFIFSSLSISSLYSFRVNHNNSAHQATAAVPATWPEQHQRLRLSGYT
jgi:hypothetical protein